jgi:hypothetical protein
MIKAIFFILGVWGASNIERRTIPITNIIIEVVNEKTGKSHVYKN